MPIIEKLGSFFLGREYDLRNKQALADRPVNYDARDLTTHAVVVGMTGSGKTGLCVVLMEEAALDSVPAIMIDPKGDITNLLLSFPDMKPEDFLPWVNADDARRKGQTPEEFAAAQAKTWGDGLASWEEGPERIRKLRESVDYNIYTPGSDAGLPVSIVSSFKAPQLDWDVETETLRDRVQGTVSSLLGLIGVDADPVQSREHILLSTILETAWRSGQDLNIPKLIMQVQKPPFKNIGVFDVETFYSEKDRFSLAMKLNNIIASPSFASWVQGEPLDVASLLYTPEGKPKHSIFYIAHLNDAERMFFVTLLLEEVISWMRSQPGTTSLRALVYMDEIFGYFPPTANPPSKRPMLTLLKQARAFGVGMVLTTQNPVDLDYKGLTNAGTWFIGKLQAQRDKERLLAGLQSAMAEAGSATDPSELDRTITSLDNRVFLMHNVNLRAPVIFTTRWAMSYLRGPLTRQQIKTLMAPRKTAAKQASPGAAAQLGGPAKQAVSTKVASPEGLLMQPPVLPPAIEQHYLPLSLTERDSIREVANLTGSTVTPTEQRLVYSPALVGFATVRYLDRKADIDAEREYTLLLPLEENDRVGSWKKAVELDLDPRDLEDHPEEGAFFVAELPSAIANAKSFTALKADLVDELYRARPLTVRHNAALKLYAQPDESERDYKIRVQQAAREQRDAALDKLRDKYEDQIEAIQVKLEREQQDLSQLEAQLKGRVAEEALSGLSTIAGALGLFGRRRKSLSGLSSAATKRRLSSQAQANIAESKADIARFEAQIEALKSELEQAANDITEQWTAAVEDSQEVKISPRKTDVDVQAVALTWLPSWQITYEDARGRTRTETIQAFKADQKA